MKKTITKFQNSRREGQKKIMQLPPVVSFKLWFFAQTIRDQKIIKAIAIFIAFCLVIILFIQPLLAQRNIEQNKLDKNISIYENLASNAHKFNGRTLTAASNAPILAIVSQQAKRSRINLKRFEPDSDGLKIWLENAKFDDAISWLEVLNQKHGIQIKQINVDKTNQSGLVDLRASLFK